MKVDDKVLEVIQDHANITQFLDQVCCAIENDDIELPNFIPTLHDGMVSDQLQLIVGQIRKTREHGRG